MHLNIKVNNEIISCFYADSITGLNKAIHKIDKANKKISATLFANEKKIF